MQYYFYIYGIKLWLWFWNALCGNSTKLDEHYVLNYTDHLPLTSTRVDLYSHQILFVEMHMFHLRPFSVSCLDLVQTLLSQLQARLLK